jgi:hypothetical protein
MMRNNIILPEGHDWPAICQMTHEFLAMIAPGFDPDSDEERLAELLADDRWGPWLDDHPDRELVAQLHREEDACLDERYCLAPELP